MVPKRLIRDVLKRIVVAAILCSGCGVVAESADKPVGSITIGSLTTCMDSAALEGKFPGVFDVFNDPDGVSILLTVFAEGPNAPGLLRRLGVSDLFPDSRLWLGYFFFTRDRLVGLRFRISATKNDRENFSSTKQFLEQNWPDVPLAIRSDGAGDYLTTTIGKVRVKAEHYNFNMNFDVYADCKPEP